MKKIIFLSLLVFLCGGANATVPRHLYSVSIPVEKQSTQSQAKAMRAGLEQVIIRLTGDPNALKNAVISQAVKNPDQYVKVFSYRNKKLKETDTSFLSVTYQANSLAALLKTAGLPIWHSDRPLVLVWVTKTQNKVDEWVGSTDQADPVFEAFQLAADTWGLPLEFPATGSEEFDVLKPGEAMGHLNLMEKISDRYQANIVLLVTLDMLPSGNIQSRWQFLGKDNMEPTWSAEGDNLNKVVNEGLGHLASQLAKRYSVGDQAENQAHIFSVTVKGLKGFKQYAQVQKQLKKIPGVRSIEAKDISGTQVEFMINYMGQVKNFLQDMQLHSNFSPEFDTEMHSQSFVYQYQEDKI